jgi:excisionase family DNA binding protein
MQTKSQRKPERVSDICADGVLTLDQFADFIGVRRSKAYQIVAAGQVEFLRIGADRKIPRRAAVAFLQRQFDTQQSA